MTQVFNRIKKYLPYLFIFLFIIIYLGQNHVYIKRDNAPPVSDAPRHLTKISEYQLIDRIALDKIIRRDPYPPLAHWVGVAFFNFMGPSFKTARYSLFVFIIIFLLSLYGIGYEYGGHFSGAAVMVLGASSPHILNYSRMFYVDFPETAMTALVFYVLLKTRGYRNMFYSILLAFVFCLAFFTKWATTFYLVFPLVWFILPHVIKSIRAFILTILAGGLAFFYLSRLKYFIFLNREFSWTEILKLCSLNFILPGAIFITAIFLWIKLRKSKWDEKTIESVNAVANGISSFLITILFTAPWLLWTSRGIFDKINLDKKTFGSLPEKFTRIGDIILVSFNYLPIFLFLGFIFIFIFKERDNFKPAVTGIYNRLVLPLNLIFCLLLMAYISVVDIRYMLSFTIFAAILAGWWLGWTAKARIPLTSIVILLSMVSITGWLFLPPGNTYTQVIKPMPYTDGVVNPRFSKKPLIPTYPNPINYDLSKIMEILEDEAGSEPEKVFWIYERNESLTADYVRFLSVSKDLKYNFEVIWPDGSNRNMLKEGRIVFISYRTREYADREYGELKKVYKNADFKIHCSVFPGDQKLDLIIVGNRY